MTQKTQSKEVYPHSSTRPNGIIRAGCSQSDTLALNALATMPLVLSNRPDDLALRRKSCDCCMKVCVDISRKNRLKCRETP